MARKDRTGNRKTRDQRLMRRIPEMGYYLVVTDTEATERCFFTGLHDSLPKDMRKKLNFDQIIRDAKKSGIHVGWSNPCFEIWMFTYFGNMPAIQESWTCCSKFGELYKSKTGQEYSKADSDMYKRLCEFGNEERALQIASQKYMQRLREGKSIPSQMCPATTVHELVGEIRRKVNRSE